MGLADRLRDFDQRQVDEKTKTYASELQEREAGLIAQWKIKKEEAQRERQLQLDNEHKFNPLLRALQVKRQLQGLVQAWGVGSVDQKPVCDDYLATLSWKATYNEARPWSREYCGPDDQQLTEHGTTYIPLYSQFSVDVRKESTAFRVSATNQTSTDDKYTFKAQGVWIGFSPDKPSVARNALEEAIFHLAIPFKNSFYPPIWESMHKPRSTNPVLRLLGR